MKTICSGMVVRSPANRILGLGKVIRVSGQTAEVAFMRFWPAVLMNVKGLEIVQLKRTEPRGELPVEGLDLT